MMAFSDFSSRRTFASHEFMVCSKLIVIRRVIMHTNGVHLSHT